MKKEKIHEDLFYLYLEIEKFLKEKNIFFKYKNIFYSRIFQICRTMLRKEYKNTEIYKKLKEYLLKNKKEIFSSSEYKRLRFHLRSGIF